MEFEYNPEKSASSKTKHGVDFEEAQALWQQITVEINAKFPGESRTLVIGLIQDKFWTAVITRRDKAVRIISCRRARIEEIKYYEQAIS